MNVGAEHVISGTSKISFLWDDKSVHQEIINWNVNQPVKNAHAYLLMAGSTNPKQSRIVNGTVIINYINKTADTLLLNNPGTWWPIEQDYMDDGFAFNIDEARPIRIHLKTGRITSDYDNNMAAYCGKMSDGGAVTVLDTPLRSEKIVKEVKLQTIATT